jgi:homoserine/homoserine lactone efflux protein
MVVAAISDTAYVLLASRAGSALSRRCIRLMTRTTGGMLMGGGVWLALSGSK